MAHVTSMLAHSCCCYCQVSLPQAYSHCFIATAASSIRCSMNFDEDCGHHAACGMECSFVKLSLLAFSSSKLYLKTKMKNYR